MPTRLQDASREISIHALREEGDDCYIGIY